MPVGSYPTLFTLTWPLISVVLCTSDNQAVLSLWYCSLISNTVFGQRFARAPLTSRQRTSVPVRNSSLLRSCDRRVFGLSSMYCYTAIIQPPLSVAIIPKKPFLSTLGFFSILLLCAAGAAFAAATAIYYIHTPCSVSIAWLTSASAILFCSRGTCSNETFLKSCRRFQIFTNHGPKSTFLTRYF